LRVELGVDAGVFSAWISRLMGTRATHPANPEPAEGFNPRRADRALKKWFEPVNEGDGINDR
jgi:hypothetical protein